MTDQELMEQYVESIVYAPVREAGLIQKHSMPPSLRNLIEKALGGGGRKDVVHPGLRGGRYYYTDSGEVRYGTEPTGEQAAAQHESAIVKPGHRIVSTRRRQGERGAGGHFYSRQHGRIIGASQSVGRNRGTLERWRKVFESMALEGEAGRYWYEESGRAILEAVGGDVAEAEKIVGVLAIFSAQSTVSANTTMALNAYFQFKAGLPIDAKTGKQNEAATKLLTTGSGWGGIKTGSFYSNLMVNIDPKFVAQKVAAQDMWMMVAGKYDHLNPSATEYPFMEDETRRLAKKLGWEPWQVQAAIWTSVKARSEATKKELWEYQVKNGILVNTGKLDQRGKPIWKVDPKKEKEANISRVKYVFRAEPTKDLLEQSSYDYGDALAERTATISYEIEPSKKSGILPGVHTAKQAEKAELHSGIEKILYPPGHKIGGKATGPRDRIAELANAPKGHRHTGFSAWDGDIGVSTQLDIPVPWNGEAGDKKDLTPESRAMIDVLALARGYVLTQDAVVWSNPVKSTNARANAHQVEISGRGPLRPTEAKKLYDGLIKHFGTKELAPAYRPDGFRVFNFLEQDVTSSQLTAFKVENGKQIVVTIATPMKRDKNGKVTEWEEADPLTLGQRSVTLDKDGYATITLSPGVHLKKDAKVMARLSNDAFHEGVEKVTSEQGFGEDVTAQHSFRSVGNYVVNDWTKDTAGEGYLGQIEATLDKHLPKVDKKVFMAEIKKMRKEVVAAYDKYSKKYKWGSATGITKARMLARVLNEFLGDSMPGGIYG